MIATIFLVALCATIAAAVSALLNHMYGHSLICQRSVSPKSPMSTPDDLDQLAVTNVKACGPIHKLSDEQIAKLHHPDDVAQLEATDGVKCFMKCLYDRSPMNDDSGASLDMDNFLAVMKSHGKDTEKLRQRFGTCSKLYSTGPDCADLWKMFMCFNGLKY